MLRKIGFRSQLGITLSIGILLSALCSTFFISGLSNQTLRSRLVGEGLSLTENFAVQSTLALLYQSEDSAAEVAKVFLSFPDILRVEIVDLDLRVIYESGASTEGLRADSPSPAVAAITSDLTDYWEFMAPVYLGSDEASSSPFIDESDGSELLGYVRVIMGKETLHTMAMGIFGYNLLVSLSLAVVLLLCLLLITGRVTRPLQDLAGLMRRAERGEKRVRAELRGTSDIRDMENAFNTMMNVMEGREEALQQARDQALESARSKSEFAANVSHELRTPMNGVLGMLDLLVDVEDAEKRAGYVSVARNSAESLLNLIDDLLSFSKNEAGRSTLEVREFDLEIVLNEIITLLGSQAQAKQLDLAYVTSPGMPLCFAGDAGRLRQVLVNLCGNAIKFTQTGSVCIEVTTVDVLSDRLTLRFEVRDTGVGIGKEQQNRIFEAFSQADESTTRRYGGTGLGLAISRQLILLMGGEIGVDSRSGSGSCFWFTLPLLRPSGHLLQPCLERLKVQHLRTLVVDNCDAMRRSVTGMFDRHDKYCDCADSYDEALRKLQISAQGVPYNLIIVAEELDGGRGIELVEAARAPAHLQAMRALLMVKRSELGDAERLPFDLVRLSKPVRNNDLVSAINGLFSQSPSRELCEPAIAPSGDGQGLFFGSRILVVEDDRANQHVAQAMLETLGCSVDLVSNGRECLEQIARASYDLVLMDCHMPELDGYKATAIIRDFEGDNSHIPVVAMTANVLEGEADKCRAAGMDDYLPKPLTREALKDVLARWLVADDSVHLGGQIITGVLDSDGWQPLSEAANDHQIVNARVLRTLREQLGPALEKLLDALVEDLPGYLADLTVAQRGGDHAQLADMAHTIKGSVANIGATRLVEASARLEVEARQGADGEMQVRQVLLAGEELVQFLEGTDLAATLHSVAPPVASVGVHSACEDNPQLENPRILIVDDDRGSRFAMVEVLRNEGYRVEEASDGRQALQSCERQSPDVILMDAVMPHMDGFAACALLQEQPHTRNVPVLIITALNDEASISKAFRSGATDYIPKPVNFWVLSRRINHLVQAHHAQRHVHRLAYNDTLTGLPNRVMFSERIRDAMKRNAGTGALAVLFLDLDRFKLVNDTLGHEAGDLLLKYFSERVQGCLRKEDMVARFGGDEFTILLDRIKSKEAVCQVAEKIHERLSRPFVFMDKEIYVSTSIGIALHPQHGDDMGTLLKNADMAMYRAKKLGEGYRFYESHMEMDVSRRLQLENDLRGALEREEFEVYYQPQEDLRTGKVVAVEALLRWRHPQRGLVGPEEFIGLAEETAQILPLGEWVLRQVCAQLQCWRAQGNTDLRASVNLSGKQIVQADLVARVTGILEESGLPPQYLELEITESILMEEPEQVIERLGQLKSMGLSLAIDDFGTGYSALNYLRRFPVDVIKIDRSFVADIISNQVDADIVKTIIDLAHVLGVHVVAEGVETELQKVFLKKQGCDLAQGFYLSRPVLATKIAEYFLGDAHTLPGRGAGV